MTEQEITLIVGQLVGEMKTVVTSVSNMDKKLDTLPCVTHGEEIKGLVNWKKECNGLGQLKALEQFKGAISLKNAIILVVATNLGTLGIAVLTRIFTGF